MEPRKLSLSEHQKTRKLWEKIFTEDTKAFLDYYYDVKTSANEIFVAENQDEIVAMLQLNPYRLRVNQQIYPVNYIIAVATDERYRKRGIMASLLKKSMKEMYSRKEPFTFLMPAAESIYTPFDFRFIYRQRQCEVTGKNHMQDSFELSYAKEKDCKEIAEFANQFLSEYQVVANRDADYYKILLAEQKSESGGVIMVKKQDRLAGVFLYAKEEQYEIREPLFFEKTDLEHAVYKLTGNEWEAVKCLAYGAEKNVPVIMARILHLETFLKCFRLKEDADFFIKVKDELLEENRGVFHIVGSKRQGVILVEKSEKQSVVCEEIEIGTLTSTLFGYLSLEEMDVEDALKKNLEKFETLEKVFLNEVV